MIPHNKIVNQINQNKSQVASTISNSSKNLANTSKNLGKAMANTANTVVKTTVNTVKDSAKGWSSSYVKAVNDTNSGISAHSGIAGGAVAIAQKAKPGPTVVATTAQYLAEIGSRTATNAYNYFIKGQK
ncbi:hypothetical protein [Paenibacillus faecalis]|uniref:hypothetical protein n=1 Tax=Paenibacillus faecalis TaxID=2079532 RepID=UPI000D10FCD7|nr:hypothetical protein [Paenibacillus faecalis]